MVTIVILVKAACKLKLVEKLRAYTHTPCRIAQRSAYRDAMRLSVRVKV